MTGEPRLNRDKFKHYDRIKLIWIGSVEARKAPKVLVEALALLPCPLRFEVHVVGEGPLRAALRQQVEDSGLAGVFVWHGQLSRIGVKRVLDAAHLHVVTSVSEGNPTTVWEAMSCGVPTLTIDHCGMQDTVSNEAGLKVPVGPYKQVVQGFAHHLAVLAISPDHLESMADKVLVDAESFHWRHRPAFWMARYREAMASFEGKIYSKNVKSSKPPL